MKRASSVDDLVTRPWPLLGTRAGALVIDGDDFSRGGSDEYWDAHAEGRYFEAVMAPPAFDLVLDGGWTTPQAGGATPGASKDPVGVTSRTMGAISVLNPNGERSAGSPSRIAPASARSSASTMPIP